MVEKTDECAADSPSCMLKSIDDNFEWTFAEVCESNYDDAKSLLWDELEGLRSWLNIPWCIRGESGD